MKIRATDGSLAAVLVSPVWGEVDAWVSEPLGEDAWAALGVVRPNPEQMVYRQYQREDVLPWDLIDHGYRNDFLWKELPEI